MMRENVLHALWDELRCQTELHATLGYVLDLGLSAPDIFEHPGWAMVWMQPNTWVYRMRKSPLPSGIESGLIIIEPMIITTIRHGSESRVCALGYSVAERIWVIFQGDALVDGEEQSRLAKIGGE